MQRPSTKPPPRWFDAVVLLAVTIVVVTAGYAAWCRTPLLWDGSYQFGATLQAGEPYAYLSRFHTRILWLPVVWLAKLTDDPRLLQAVYGLPFLLAPAVGLACCWWFVRRHMPTLIIWAAIGILAMPLPGQIFVINDSIFQQHLFWPVLFGLLVPLTRGQQLIWALLAVFQLVHQIGLILLAGAAVTTFILAWRPWERGRPRPLLASEQPKTPALPGAFIVALTLLLLMAAKVWWTSIPGTPYYDSYAAAEASWESAKDRWWKAVWGAPLNGLVMVWLAAGVICRQAWLFTQPGRERAARLSSSVAMLLLLVGVLHWAFWSRSPSAWGGAIEYRRWLVPLTMPIFILATIEAIWRAKVRQSDARQHASPSTLSPVPSLSTEPTMRLRASVILLLAAAYATVIGRQSTQINEMNNRLSAEIAASATATIILPPDHWLRQSPLEHWSMGWHSLALQGKKPQKWVAPTDLPPEHLETLDADPPRLPISKFDTLPPEPGPGGWYDLTEVIKQAAKERHAPSPGVPGEGTGSSLLR